MMFQVKGYNWIQVPVERNVLRIHVSKHLSRMEMMYKNDVDMKGYLFHDLTEELKKSNLVQYNINIKPGMVRSEDVFVCSATLNLVNKPHEKTYMNDRVFQYNGKEFSEDEIAYAIKQTFPERLI